MEKSENNSCSAPTYSKVSMASLRPCCRASTLSCAGPLGSSRLVRRLRVVMMANLLSPNLLSRMVQAFLGSRTPCTYLAAPSLRCWTR